MKNTDRDLVTRRFQFDDAEGEGQTVVVTVDRCDQWMDTEDALRAAAEQRAEDFFPGFAVDTMWLA
jgi:hypothetical protein